MQQAGSTTPASDGMPGGSGSGRAAGGAPHPFAFAGLVRRIGLGAGLAAFGALSTACRTPAPTFVAPTAPPAGAALYQTHCALCHGAKGEMPPEITHPVNIGSQTFLRLASDEMLADSIRLGRPGEAAKRPSGTKMPAFGDPRAPILSPEQIRAVVGYLRSWQTLPPVTPEPFEATGGDAARGAEAFALRCASCHGQDGLEAGAPRLAGRTFQDTYSDAMIAHVVRSGRDERMPAFKLRDAELADLVAYVRSLAH